jgi:hypothetical protein
MPEELRVGHEFRQRKKAKVAGFLQYIQIPVQQKGLAETILPGHGIHRQSKTIALFHHRSSGRGKIVQISGRRRFADKKPP